MSTKTIRLCKKKSTIRFNKIQFNRVIMSIKKLFEFVKRKEKREKILLICWGVCKQCKSLALNSLEAKEVPIKLNIIDVNINTLYVIKSSFVLVRLLQSMRY